MLPSYIKIDSDNPKKFKLVLQPFLYENSFCSLDILNFSKVKCIYIRYKLVFERLAYKVGMYVYTHTYVSFFFNYYLYFTSICLHSVPT